MNHHKSCGVQVDQGKIKFRLVVLGCPNYLIMPFISIIKLWVTCSGIEWTISRLKDLKVDLIRRRTGLPPLTWIRKNRRGDIAGPVGSLFRWADKSDKNFRIAIQCLMVYTLFVFTKVTEKQFEKFKSGVESQPVPLNLSLKTGIAKEAKIFASEKVLRRPDPLMIYEGSVSKNSPRLFGGKSVSQSVNVVEEIFYFNTPAGWYLYQKYPSIFSEVLSGFSERKRHLESLRKFELENSDIPVGNVAFIQEPGGKLRSVANPYRLFQMALKPFGDHLYKMARQMPWDCTHDQSAAFTPVQNALKKGTRVHSIDLSSATDMFPLELQIDCVKALLPNNQDYIDLWFDLCRGSWKMPNKKTICWMKGQPLGMYPSFAAFTITHGLLLKHLLGRKWKGEFYVVGDDVVILDDRLAEQYKKTLDLIGCPYSPSKTITSNEIAEFAGKIIIEDAVIPQMKWRELSDDNFLDLCKALGPKSRLLLRSRQRKIFDLVKNLMDPIGLNFSIPGDNLETMIKRTMDSPLFSPEKSILKSLMGLRRRLNSHLYESHIGEGSLAEEISADSIAEMTSTFDEKVKFVLNQTIFFRYSALLPILDGLSSLPEALELYPRLPLLTSLPSRVTTLERYERLDNRA